MGICTVHEDEQSIIRVLGRFDTHCRKEFLAAIGHAVAHSAPVIQVDLAGSGYLDSSALGLLLELRDNARGAGKTVILANAGGGVRRILDIASFNRLFEMT